MSKRPPATQHEYGELQGMKMPVPGDASGLGSLQLLQFLDGRKEVYKSFSMCETQEEARGWFDGFIGSQKRKFPTAWVSLYETLDLIRTTEWYWKDQGFESFESWWVANGTPLFGQWAELEATYNYAKLAAPHLFDVEYEEAKALAQQLAQYRDTPAAMSKGGNNPRGRNQHSEDESVHTRSTTPSPESAVAIEDYVLDVRDPQFKDGFRKGVNSQKNGQEDVFRRFARLRRDNPDVAGQFLDGQFIRRFKNGKVEPDLKAAEVAAGLREEGQPIRRKPDPLAYCGKLASKLSSEQLREHIKFCQTLLQQEVSN